MRTGFDEVYVVCTHENNLESECLYDSYSAYRIVLRLRDSGYDTAYKTTLEEFLINKQ